MSYTPGPYPSLTIGMGDTRSSRMSIRKILGKRYVTMMYIIDDEEFCGPTNGRINVLSKAIRAQILNLSYVLILKILELMVWFLLLLLVLKVQASASVAKQGMVLLTHH